MEKKLIILLQESLSLIKIDDSFATSFYNDFFKIAPDARAFFSNDPKIQAEKLTMAFELFATGLKDSSKLQSALNGLGALHHEKGVSSNFFPLFEASLIKTLINSLGEQFTPELIDAWTKYLHFLSSSMKESMQKTSAHNGPQPNTSPSTKSEW